MKRRDSIIEMTISQSFWKDYAPCARCFNVRLDILLLCNRYAAEPFRKLNGFSDPSRILAIR